MSTSVKEHRITIDPEFKALIPPLAPEELEQLEANLVADGCRDPLVLWNGILLDGHNRHSICIRRGIAYTTTTVELKDRDAAIEWIILNQFGRRNITIFTRGELALRLEPIIAARAAAAQARKPQSVLLKSGKQKPVHVDKELAKIAGVSADTIAKTRDVQKHATEEVKTALRTSKDKSLNRVAKDIKETRQKQARKQKRLEVVEAAPESDERIIVGDFRKCGSRIVDGSVSLIFTDRHEGASLPPAAPGGSEEQPGNISPSTIMVPGHDDGDAGGYPAQDAPHGRGGGDAASPPSGFQVAPRRFYDDCTAGVRQQPHDFAVESLAVLPDATQQVGQALAFNGDDVDQPFDGIVARRQGADFYGEGR